MASLGLRAGRSLCGWRAGRLDFGPMLPNPWYKSRDTRPACPRLQALLDAARSNAADLAAQARRGGQASRSLEAALGEARRRNAALEEELAVLKQRRAADVEVECGFGDWGGGIGARDCAAVLH